MEEKIIQASSDHVVLIAALVSDANKDVASQFNLTNENAPKHPSFCTSDWIKEDFDRGVIYFIFERSNKPVGCVAFEAPIQNVAYLNRLSVIPSARNRGIGNKLVLHHIHYSKKNAISKVSIGIIAQHTELKNWYKRIGFQSGETKQFEHLPFEVCYMSYVIKKSHGTVQGVQKCL
ncbi:MAG: GNAT family N-acetyltransferase [Deltaproteobacteria bacterium]|nr:GNAT family N-acetyltransferase [Deltaproteobacteria bacterium]